MNRTKFVRSGIYITGKVRDGEKETETERIRMPAGDKYQGKKIQEYMGCQGLEGEVVYIFIWGGQIKPPQKQ